jgi:hypothetical protein
MRLKIAKLQWNFPFQGLQKDAKNFFWLKKCTIWQTLFQTAKNWSSSFSASEVGHVAKTVFVLQPPNFCWPS